MRNKFPKRIFILLLIVAVVLLCIFTPLLRYIGNAVGFVTSPIQSGITKCVSGVQGYFAYLGRLDEVDAQNAQLLKKIDKMNQQLAGYERMKSENDRLNEMLELKNGYSENNAVAAEIIAKNSGNWFEIFTINKGTSDGISVNDTVINSKGLIGKVSECGTNYAKVVTIIDTEHSVSGIIGRTGDFVQVDGDIKLMKNGFCKMSIITEDADVMIGDTVETSGMGGVYPKNIVIGTVQKFEENADGTGTYAILKPYVDFQHLYEVLVIKGNGGK